MSAVVLSLCHIFGHTEYQAKCDWTNQERAHLVRILDALLHAGFCAEMETGLSDEGEPWAVYCRTDTADVIVHIARINQAYIFDSSVLNLVLRGKTFESIIDQFVQSRALTLSSSLSPSSSSSSAPSQISMHPAAMLSAIVLAAFLVSEEIQKNPAFSKNTGSSSGVPEKTGTLIYQLASFFSDKTGDSDTDETGTINIYNHIGLLAAAYVFISEYLSEPATLLDNIEGRIQQQLDNYQTATAYHSTTIPDIVADAQSVLRSTQQNETFYQTVYNKNSNASDTDVYSSGEIHNNLSTAIVLTKTDLDIGIHHNNQSFVVENKQVVSEAAYSITYNDENNTEMMPYYIQDQNTDTPLSSGILSTSSNNEQQQQQQQPFTVTTSGFDPTSAIQTFLESFTDYKKYFHLLQPDTKGTLHEASLVSEILGPQQKEKMIKAFANHTDNMRIFEFGGDLIVYDQDVITDAQTISPLYDMQIYSTVIDEQNIVFIGLSGEVGAVIDAGFA